MRIQEISYRKSRRSYWRCYEFWVDCEVLQDFWGRYSRISWWRQQIFDAQSSPNVGVREVSSNALLRFADCISCQNPGKVSHRLLHVVCQYCEMSLDGIRGTALLLFGVAIVYELILVDADLERLSLLWLRSSLSGKFGSRVQREFCVGNLGRYGME